LAAVLTPGKRAASVGVDAVTGTAGLIWPGDHVDLILTQQIEDSAVPLGRRLAAETVLKDVRVIAVDQQMVQGGASTTGDTSQQSRTVTLEVSPEDVEKVAVATRLGRLSLAVRPVDAGAPVDQKDHAVTYSQDVSTAIGNIHKPDEQSASHVLHVYSGTSDKEYPF
jgi:pilus assembly protein CpaB